MTHEAQRKSNKTKTVITVFLCVAVASAIFFIVQRLLVPKYQRGVVEGSFVEEYYDEEVPHEVIFLGDCDVYENYSPIELYRGYGISSYIRGTAEQYMWQSYYLLEDTLRTETPKVVVLSVHGLQSGGDVKEAYNRMTLDGMRWSGTKAAAINASMTEDETFLSYVFPILRYHDRWESLTDVDFEHVFTKDRVSHNGYYMRCDVMPQGEFPAATPLVDYTLDSKSMDYMQKIADLCKEKGIELVLVRAPIEYPYWYDEWEEQVEAFAAENNLEYFSYINYMDEIGLDMSQDTYDAGLHLNIYGAEKLSDCIGAYLTSTYELTDFREDADVSTVYEEKIAFYEDMKADQLSEIAGYGQLMSYGANATE